MPDDDSSEFLIEISGSSTGIPEVERSNLPSGAVSTEDDLSVSAVRQLVDK